MAHTDISLRFLGEHEKLNDLFKDFRKLKKDNASRAWQLFQEFFLILQQHLMVEEKIIFPVFSRKCRERRNVIEKLLEEHEKIRGHIESIRGHIQRGDFRTDRDEVLLQSALDEHERNESASFYPLLDRCITREEDHMIVQAVDRVSK